MFFCHFESDSKLKTRKVRKWTLKLRIDHTHDLERTLESFIRKSNIFDNFKNLFNTINYKTVINRHNFFDVIDKGRDWRDCG